MKSKIIHIEYKAEEGIINIFLGHQSEQSIISFSTKQPFLQLAKGKSKVRYRMASFQFKDSYYKKCKTPIIEEVGKSSLNKAYIKGHFSEEKSTQFEIIFKAKDGQTLDIDIKWNKEQYNRAFLTYETTEEEQFFGFGEQFSHVNMKGKKPFIFVEEQGIGRGDQPISTVTKLAGVSGNEYTSYAPMPFYITNYNKACLIKNSTYLQFDLSKPDKVGLQVWDNSLKMRLWQAKSPFQLIEKYTKTLGRMPKLPDWAYGTWLGLQGGTEKVTKVIREAKQAGNPITALWIQDWVGKRKTRFGSQLWWTWEADETSYPNFKAFCQQMNEQGVKVLGYVNTFIIEQGKVFEEAKEKGYLVKNLRGKNYLIETAGFPAHLLDLSNPAAFEWFKNILKTNLMDMGLSGWMADFSEWLPWDAQLHSGEDAKRYHNQYPVEWARLNREAIQEAGKEGEIVFFVRAAYTYTSRYATLLWQGDQMVNWGQHDGIASTVPALLSSGISGTPLNHSDIGGYTSFNLPILKVNRSQELLFRWAELNAFTPVFRTHEGILPDKNHQVYSNEETIAFFAKMGRLHYALKEYLKFLVQEASKKGYPIIRHLYLHYPKDANTYHLEHQFLLGEDLLVLPVLEKGATTVKGYFPKGKWRHLWTGNIIKGKQFATIDAPIGQPAVFLKVKGKWYKHLKKKLSLSP